MDSFDDRLSEIADVEAPKWPEPAAAGEFTGVAFHCGHAEGMSEGAMLTSAYARKMGARLIIAADTHDAIREGGVAEFERHTTLAEHGTRRMAEANAERDARRIHEIADALAQRALGDLDPYPGESPHDYERRMRDAERRFKEAYPEWQPERFSRRSS